MDVLTLLTVFAGAGLSYTLQAGFTCRFRHYSKDM